jgi:hypothetical protein
MLCRITSPEKSQKSNPFFLRFQNTNTSLSTKKTKTQKSKPKTQKIKTPRRTKTNSRNRRKQKLPDPVKRTQPPLEEQIRTNQNMK